MTQRDANHKRHNENRRTDAKLQRLPGERSQETSGLRKGEELKKNDDFFRKQHRKRFNNKSK